MDAPIEELKSATRKAFEAVIAHCLDEQVDFLLIAGDVFDGNCRDFNTILWLRHQIRRLGEVPVFIVLGNHDYRIGTTQQIPWPDNTHIFPCDKAATIQFRTKDGSEVAIHGQSFAKAAVTDNLAIHYPDAIGGALNIGLLHCNYEGALNHDPYAPCKRADLVAKGYDYWALGHIHKATIYKPASAIDPWVVYPGNIQGRHIRESGPKGCFLVSAEQGAISKEPEFLRTDSLSWHELKSSPNPDATSWEGVLKALETQLGELVALEAKRPLAIRVRLTGKTKLYTKALRDWPELELKVLDFCSLYPNVWVEKVANGLEPAHDLNEIPKDSFLAKIMGDFASTLESGEHYALLDSLAKEVEQASGDLVHKCAWQKGEHLAQILEKSRAHLLGKLAEEGFFED